MSDDLFDAQGHPVLRSGEVMRPLPLAAMQDASTGLVQSLNDVVKVQTSAVQGVELVRSMFDGSRTVAVGGFKAPVGLVLAGGALALLAYNRGR